MLVWFFSSYILLYIEKNPVKTLSKKFLKIELKTYTPVDLKFIFKLIKLKVLHYIQYDFICQHPGLSKYQTGIFKILLLFHPQIMPHILMAT